MVKPIHDDRGAIEGFVIATMLALTAFTVLFAIIAGVFIRHEQARTAADFAALAAAQTQECAAADEAAKRNGAALRSCALDLTEARVTVAAPSRYGPALISVGAPREFVAYAHAKL